MPSHLTTSAVSTNTNGTPSSFLTLNGPSSEAETAGTSTATLVDMTSRDMAEQLEILRNELVLENRIKEGAENFLNMQNQLTDGLRSQVQYELSKATSRIDSLTRRIDELSVRMRSRAQAAQSPPSRRAPSLDRSNAEDFRTTMRNAVGLVSMLSSLTRPTAVQSPDTSTSSAGASSSTDAESRIGKAMSELSQILERNVRVGYELNVEELLSATLPALGDNHTMKTHTAAYRLLRYALVEPETAKLYSEDGALEWYMLKSLTRDNKHAAEKEQAIKLLRAIIEVGTVRADGSNVPGTGVVPLTEAIVRALMAIGEQPDDPFRPVCILTVTELLLIDIDLVAKSDGIPFLLHVFGDGPPELEYILASTFLHIIDYPRTRAYLRLGVDLEVALSAVTDAYGKGPEHGDRIRGCARIIQLMLCTWSGLLYFCMDDMRAIRALVDTLRIPSLDTRELIIDLIFDLLNIRSPDWHQTFMEGRRLTMYRKHRDISDFTGSARQDVETGGERTQQSTRFHDQYLALLVMVLTHAGLFDALTCLLQETTQGSALTRKATLLMAEVLQMSNRLLPLSLAASIQAVPRLFNLATDYSDGEHRIIGTAAMSAIDSFNRNRSRLVPAPEKHSNRPRTNSIEDAVRRGQRQVEQVKLKMSMQMDDKTFQASLLETQVMLHREHTKWNFDVLQDLVDGPLLNPKRMEEAVKGSRFIRRVMSFFHPFNHRFSDLPRIKANLKWVRLGNSLLATLMASSEGVKYLQNEDQFLAQIVKSFAQLDPFNGLPDSDPIFSKKRVSETLTYGYLEMLGTLSRYKDGIELMEKFKVFTAFYHLSELRSREDLMKGIIENLDYSIDGHPRIVLSKALTSSYKHIRLYATQHLGELIRGSISANAWTLRLLLTQLYDPSPEVCELAVSFLQEVCESKEILTLVVEMQPTMHHLGEIGHPLLLKFMSTPVGFRYLYDTGYIDREMDMWFNERNIYYVVQVEVYLSKVFNSSADEDEDVLGSEGSVPPHFYGEMAKTELGCQILQEKGHFTEFSQFIRKHGDESDDTELIMKLKSILWAVGHVGATEGGLPFLEEEEIIPAVVDIAHKSAVPSIKGTCFFVLGLISSTLQGAEILDDYDWEATLSPLGVPNGICVPADFEDFIQIPPWTPVKFGDSQSRLLPPSSDIEIEILTAIQNLANAVIANTASKSLARMKSRPEYRSAFASPSVFYRAIHLISTQRYRLPVRRYVFDLFNVGMRPEVTSKLNDCRKSLNAPDSFEPSTAQKTRMSMFGPLGNARTEDSDSDEEEYPPTRAQAPIVPPVEPAVSLQPVHRIVGFAA